jgi:hypothetical protein
MVEVVCIENPRPPRQCFQGPVALSRSPNQLVSMSASTVRCRRRARATPTTRPKKSGTTFRTWAGQPTCRPRTTGSLSRTSTRLTTRIGASAGHRARCSARSALQLDLPRRQLVPSPTDRRLPTDAYLPTRLRSLTASTRCCHRGRREPTGSTFGGTGTFCCLCRLRKSPTTRPRPLVSQPAGPRCGTPVRATSAQSGTRTT